MGEYILTTNGDLYHHGIKGQKWGIRRYQNKDGTLTPAGKKQRLTRAQRDARKLADVATKYYDKVNKYNALLDTRAATGGEESMRNITDMGRKTQKLVNKLQKRYGLAEVIPTFEENGYVVKSVEASLVKLDRLGRVSTVNKSFSPVETYNSWRADANPKRLKALDAVDAKYSKKMKAAKTQDEKELLQLEWDEAIDDVESRY